MLASKECINKEKSILDKYYRVELDFDRPRKVNYETDNLLVTFVIILSREEKNARGTFEVFKQTLSIDGVLRLYGPNRVLKDSIRVHFRPINYGDY